MSISILVVWRFIHSEKFSKEISQRVSLLLTEKVGVDLKFRKVEFGVFPPSTKFREVVLNKPLQDKNGAEIVVQELGVYFTYASLFSSNLEIDELELKNGNVKLQIEEDKTSPEINWKKINIEDLFAKYGLIYDKLPIHLNILKFTQIDTQINKIKLYAQSISISPHKKEIRVKAKLTKISSESPDFKVGEVDFLASMNKEILKIDSLNIVDKANLISLNFEILNSKDKLNIRGNGKYNFILDSISSYLSEVSPELKKITGGASGNLSFAGDLFNPDVKLKIIARKLSSEWINLEYASVILHKKKDFIYASGLDARNGNERYKSKSSGALYDLRRNAFVQSKTEVELIDAQTNTFLYTIRSALSVLKGNVTGKIVVGWDGKLVTFDIKNKTQFKNFELISNSNGKKILKNNGFAIDRGLIKLESSGAVGIDLNLSMQNTHLHAIGKILRDSIAIDIANSVVDLGVFGPIAGVALEGSGPVAMKIFGPFDDVRFDLNVQWKKFSVIDLHLGDVKTNFILALKDMSLLIPYLEGHFNLSTYNASGKLDFGENQKLDLLFDFKETTFKDAQKMYALAFRNLKNFQETDLKFETRYKVTGGFDLDKLVIEGKIKGRDLRVFNEEADLVNLDFNLKNKLLSFEKIKIQKARGEVSGKFSVNLANNHMELLGDGKGLKLTDFNHYRNTRLDYDAELMLEFSGSGTGDKFPSRIKIKSNEAYIDNFIASPSSALVIFENNEIKSKLDILSGKIKADVTVRPNEKEVSIDALIDTGEIRELLGVLSSHNMSDKTIVGKIKSKLQAEFNYGTGSLSKLFCEVMKFNLKKGDVDIRNTPGRSIISLDNKLIKKWDLQFTDGPDFFSSHGDNISSGHMSLVQTFSIKANIFQLFSPYVEKADGKIKGTYQVDLGNKLGISSFHLYAKNNSLKFKKMPGLITDLEYDIKKNNETFVINKVLGKYGEGEFKITGDILFENIFPKVNLEYKIERSTVPLFKRSSILLSGTGSLQGSKMPYRLNGKFQLLHGEFLDDPSEYSGDKKISLEEFRKYMPEKNIESRESIIDFNLTVETMTTPVLVKNNMTEIYLKGTGQITGTPLDPEINGRAEAIPVISKFKFKGHDFIINQGYVELRNTAKNISSDIKFIGISKISDYDMKIDLSGKIDKLNINLSSEPPLAQEDLLSLLTLGVTSDMSKNLEAGERKFVTTVGIGTLLVDQLKINEDLNSSLGLKLSVMPEFKEDVTSLVQGKSAVSDSSTSSKLKSSTKIKVNKQISKQIDVSLSSTVGGSLEQKQEVNVNYNFNKNLSLEGVYEVKPSEDTSTSTSTPNSVGADLKYRWSF